MYRSYGDWLTILLFSSKYFSIDALDNKGNHNHHNLTTTTITTISLTTNLK